LVLVIALDEAAPTETRTSTKTQRRKTAMKRSFLVLVLLANVMLSPAHAAPLGTGFTYQGRLTDNEQLANGTYDFQFRLFDAATNGAQVPVVLAYPTMAVSNGLFTTGLDFGSNVFNGTTWWLEISLRRSGTFGEFIFLSPRQPLTPTPNALFSVNAAQAATATTANGVIGSAISSAQLNTPNGPAGGQVLSFNGTSLVWTNASTVAAAWNLNGNSDTTTGVNFLGTTDNQALELRVNGRRALRIVPNTNGAPNLIGGASVNQVDAGVVGATIAGGGAASINLTAPNRISSDFGVIGGGGFNTIQTGALESTIGGGAQNSIRSGAAASTISGGLLNTINSNAYDSVIGGGYTNLIDSGAGSSTIGGGSATPRRRKAAMRPSSMPWSQYSLSRHGAPGPVGSGRRMAKSTGTTSLPSPITTTSSTPSIPESTRCSWPLHQVPTSPNWSPYFLNTESSPTQVHCQRLRVAILMLAA